MTDLRKVQPGMSKPPVHFLAIGLLVWVILVLLFSLFIIGWQYTVLT